MISLHLKMNVYSFLSDSMTEHDVFEWVRYLTTVLTNLFQFLRAAKANQLLLNLA